MSELAVLIVDDNVDNLEVLKLHFELKGFRVISCSTHQECFEQLNTQEFSAIVLDVHMPEKTGFEICREIRFLNPDLAVVFFSADATEISRNEGKESGADAYLVKPDDFAEVIPTVRKLIETARLKGESDQKSVSVNR